MGISVPGLGVTWALAERGIPVIGVDSRRTPMSYSRHMRFHLAPPTSDGLALRDFYLELARAIDGTAVLFPTADEQVEFLAEHREALEPHFRFFIADTDVIEEVVSKHGLTRLSEQFDLPLPRTVSIRDRDRLEACAAELRFPCVIKPEFNYSWKPERLAAIGLGPLKALPVEDREELLVNYDRLSTVDPAVIIQEMVVGPDEGHYDYHVFVDPDGEIRGEFLGRKLRLAPPHYGVGTYVESLVHEDVILAARRIVRLVGYRGVANVQFKRDERDGIPYLLDFNPRFNLWTGLAVACGVDLPHLYWCHCLGLPYDSPTGWQVGRHWLHLVRDLNSMQTYSRDGTCSWSEWIKTVRRPSVPAVMSMKDPLPGLVEITRATRRIVSRA
jgi:predicted ATP-grasp superfamily ATP-dependent carboligase